MSKRVTDEEINGLQHRIVEGMTTREDLDLLHRLIKQIIAEVHGED